MWQPLTCNAPIVVKVDGAGHLSVQHRPVDLHHPEVGPDLRSRATQNNPSVGLVCHTPCESGMPLAVACQCVPNTVVRVRRVVQLHDGQRNQGCCVVLLTCRVRKPMPSTTASACPNICSMRWTRSERAGEEDCARVLLSTSAPTVMQPGFNPAHTMLSTAAAMSCNVTARSLRQAGHRVRRRWINYNDSLRL